MPGRTSTTRPATTGPAWVLGVAVGLWIGGFDIIEREHSHMLQGGPRKITSIKIVYKGKEIPARVIDTGDADQEVHSGDWAIIKTRDLDLPALHVDSAFAYDFAEPIFRLGNDYSKGIILATGYVGQRTPTGLGGNEEHGGRVRLPRIGSQR